VIVKDQFSLQAEVTSVASAFLTVLVTLLTKEKIMEYTQEQYKEAIQHLMGNLYQAIYTSVDMIKSDLSDKEMGLVQALQHRMLHAVDPVLDMIKGDISPEMAKEAEQLRELYRIMQKERPL
jgi:Na+-translocating ferredoxin:NAD+ oxidoreductase RnfG subunit